LLGISLWVGGLALYRNNVSLRALASEAGMEEVAEALDGLRELLGGHSRAQRIERAVERVGQVLTGIAVLGIIVALVVSRGGGGPPRGRKTRAGRRPQPRDEPDWLADRRN
jgi:hypothetical protein